MLALAHDVNAVRTVDARNAGLSPTVKPRRFSSINGASPAV